MSPARRETRLRMLVALVLMVFLAVVLRLFRIQVLMHDEYRSMAEGQHTTRMVVEADRGRILDRRGYLLAGNRSVAYLQLYWPEVPEGEEASVDSFVASLGEHALVDVPLERTDGNVILANSLPLEQALSAMMELPPGVSCELVCRRTYPLGDMVAGLVGRYSDDACEGLEDWFNSTLTGTDGELVIERSELGTCDLTDPEAENTPAVDGYDLILTIDSRFQCILMEELQAAVDTSGASWAAAVALDPWTGDVLAAASVPVRSENGSLAMNHCFQGYHEPGSTFKIIAYAAAVEEGLLDPLEDTFDCSAGYVTVSGERIYDAHREEVLTGEEVMIRSSNVGTVRIGALLPDSVLYDYCTGFGFGSLTTVEYPGESRGIVPRPGSPAWSGVSAAQIAIGQEVTVTPLQLGLAYCAIANGGSLYYPRLLLSAWDGTEWVEREPIPRSCPVSPSTAETVRQALVRVMEEGTGSGIRVSGVSLAGKTGTAERLLCEGSGYLSAFVGMFPADNPGVVLAVVVDGPEYEYRWGSACAGPAFASMVERMLAVEPSLALGPAGRSEPVRFAEAAR